MEYGKFVDGGSGYKISTPLTPDTWNNHLYNDAYYLELSQTLQGAGYIVKDYNRTLCLHEYRYFYLVDRKSNEIWNPNYVPLAKEPDRYSCTHGIWMTELQSEQQSIESTIRVVVPPTGTREIWSVSLKNRSEYSREISLYSIFGFYDHGVMGGECTYDADSQLIIKYAFPYHTLYEEKEKVENDRAYTYLFSNIKPASYEMSKRRFFGKRGQIGIPEGVQRRILSGVKAEAEEFCGAFSFEFTLKPNEVVSFILETGAAVSKEEVLRRKKEIFEIKAEEISLETKKFWENSFDRFYMKTQDENLNAFGNYWLKKQISLLTRQNRGSSYCPIRNQLQDAMGYSIVQPAEGWKYILDIMKLQKRNGFIQQWHDTTGVPPRGLCLLKHTDGPVWLVICTETVIRQNGDMELLYMKVPYLDGGTGTVLEHMKLALEYLADNVGTHGLCLIGDGDWNDPMNGVGREGKGESVWLSMALIYAIKLLLPYLKVLEPDSYASLSTTVENMKAAINLHAWSEKWYAAAIHDNGSLLGNEDDRLFLNSQSWAIMADVADIERRKVLLNVLKELDTPFGPLILSTPFEKWDSRWGRLSVKKSGTTENGSVYCHASMFLAFAKALCGDGDGLYETIWKTLPTNPENPPEKNLQIPIYLANYYYGLRDSENFGRSSRHYGTGTTAWMLMLIVEELIGARATVEGLEIYPCLPTGWEQSRCRRRYKNAIYDITIKRGQNSVIRIDNIPYEGNILPYEEGKLYQVEVTII